MALGYLFHLMSHQLNIQTISYFFIINFYFLICFQVDNIKINLMTYIQKFIYFLIRHLSFSFYFWWVLVFSKLIIKFIFNYLCSFAVILLNYNQNFELLIIFHQFQATYYLNYDEKLINCFRYYLVIME